MEEDLNLLELRKQLITLVNDNHNQKNVHSCI